MDKKNRLNEAVKYLKFKGIIRTQDDIAAHLENDYGIGIERKAIGRNISLLKEAGIDIESRRAGTYIETRDFEDSELIARQAEQFRK